MNARTIANAVEQFINEQTATLKEELARQKTITAQLIDDNNALTKRIGDMFELLDRIINGDPEALEEAHYALDAWVDVRDQEPTVSPDVVAAPIARESEAADEL